MLLNAIVKNAIRSIIVAILFVVLMSGMQTSAQLPHNIPLVKMEVERLPDLNLPRAGHNVFYAGDELTVVGGHTSGFVLTSTAEFFCNGKWHLMPTIYSHDNGTAVVLQQGRKVLIAGGHDKNLGIGQSFEVEMYDRMKHTFTGFGCLEKKRAFAQGAEMSDGCVLIAGNHTGNDGFELYDGKKFFHHVKDVSIWRSSPYILPVADGNVILFGPVWRNDCFEPCDTVDQLKGEPFRVPLLATWMPLLYNQNSHVSDSYIGDFTYLVAAYNHADELAFILVRDTVFTLLPTVGPVPTEVPWGKIHFNRSAVADRQARRAYLLGNDTTGRAYVLRVDYDKRPAPLTLYYTDPLPDFGDTTPVLTPEGNLVITGGITDDNFAPFASVWLLYLVTKPVAAGTIPIWQLFFLAVVVLLIIISGLLLWRCRYRKCLANGNVPENCVSGNDEVMMKRICQLMEEERLFQNKDLKVIDVAAALGVQRRVVSACIKVQRNCSFSQFVNGYRVEYAQKMLHQKPDAKILRVAEESGFANERTFFRTFKTFTGLAPKEWIAGQKD